MNDTNSVTSAADERRQKRAQYQRDYRARKRSNSEANSRAEELIWERLAPPMRERAKRWDRTPGWREAENMQSAVTRVAWVYGDAVPREDEDFEQWLLKRVESNLAGFIEQIKGWLDKSIGWEILDPYYEHFGDDFLTFYRDYDHILKCVYGTLTEEQLAVLEDHPLWGTF